MKNTEYVCLSLQTCVKLHTFIVGVCEVILLFGCIFIWAFAVNTFETLLRVAAAIFVLDTDEPAGVRDATATGPAFGISYCLCVQFGMLL